MLDHTLKSDVTARWLEVITETGRRRWFSKDDKARIVGDPLAYLTDVLTRIVNGHPNRDIDQLLPWAYRAQALKAVA
jgi:hypothetical protein